jgi:hypothetical protein
MRVLVASGIATVLLPTSTRCPAKVSGAARRLASYTNGLRASLSASGPGRFRLGGDATGRARRRHGTPRRGHAATGNKGSRGPSQRLLATITAGVAVEPYSRDVFDRALAEHQGLVEAVVQGDVDRAGRVAESHFAMTQRTMRGVLQREWSSRSHTIVGWDIRHRPEGWVLGPDSCGPARAARVGARRDLCTVGPGGGELSVVGSSLPVCG